MALFESYDRRIGQIAPVLAEYGISSVEECRDICKAAGFDPYEIVAGIQPISFENARWAYTVGAAIALKKGVKNAAEAAEAIGIGLQAFCIPGFWRAWKTLPPQSPGSTGLSLGFPGSIPPSLWYWRHWWRWCPPCWTGSGPAM